MEKECEAWDSFSIPTGKRVVPLAAISHHGSCKVGGSISTIEGTSPRALCSPLVVGKEACMRFITLAALVLVTAMTGARFAAAEPPDGPLAEWPSYGGDAGGSRYSPLTQITKDNVATLTVAWVYHTGDVSDGSDGRRKSAFEATPIVASGTMYVTTPFNRVVALDPETGREQWQFDPQIDVRGPYSEGLITRGVALWTDPYRAAGAACRQRLFLATIDARLFALDAATGQPCVDFGTEGGPGGQIDLTLGIANITRRGEYQETSAPAVVEDLVIVGSSIADNRSEEHTSELQSLRHLVCRLL